MDFFYSNLKWDENFPIDFDTISPMDAFAQTFKIQDSNNNNFFLNQTNFDDRGFPNKSSNEKKPTREGYHEFLTTIEKMQREELLLTQNLQERYSKIEKDENKFLEQMQEKTTKETMKETIIIMKDKLNYFIRFAELFDIDQWTSTFNNSFIFNGPNNNDQKNSSNIPKTTDEEEISISQSTDCEEEKITKIDEKPLRREEKDGMEIIVLVQPSPHIVANRYVTPAPEVKVSLPKMEGLTYLIVVKIVFYGTDQEVVRTSNKGKKEKGQPILEGITKFPIAKQSELISFNKLKISEVSSKHGQKPFSFLFSIGKLFSQKKNHFFFYFEISQKTIRSKSTKKK